MKTLVAVTILSIAAGTPAFGCSERAPAHVVRVLAEQSDPSSVRLADICSRDLITIAPDASVGEAVRLIREKSIRRLPVVEDDGQVVGIVSLGDIAVARDRKSALGDISAAAPNTSRPRLARPDAPGRCTATGPAGPTGRARDGRTCGRG